MPLKNKTKAKFPFKSLVDGVSDFWTLSASGTNEYYYNQTDVPIEPLNVQESGADLTPGTIGTLAAGEWGWGDNDALGADTIYVRLNSTTPDPDGNPADFVKCSEPLEIFQATLAVETIILSLIIANTESTNAKCVLYITNSVDVAQFVSLFEISVADSNEKWSEKIVIEPDQKLKFMTSNELVSLILTEDES